MSVVNKLNYFLISLKFSPLDLIAFKLINFGKYNPFEIYFPK